MEKLEIFLRELTTLTQRYGIVIDAKQSKLIDVVEGPIATGLVCVEDGYITSTDNTDAAEFAANDGTMRKAYYGAGKQPWDTMVEVGWAPDFAAGSVLKYLRRRKDMKHSLESARWYYPALIKLSHTSSNALLSLTQLRSTLDAHELEFLKDL